MKGADLVSQTVRQSESGRCWEEVVSGAQSTVRVPKHSTFRVRATGATTVTIDGVLAMTMSTGEIAIFNAGDGDPASGFNTVSVAIGAANGFMQVAREVARNSVNL